MAIGYPMLPILSAALVGEVRLLGFLVAAAIAGVLFLLAQQMRVVCEGGELRIRNMFTSRSIQLTEAAEVGLAPPLLPGYAAILELTTTSGRIYPIAGVSVWSDQLRMKRRFTNKKSLAQIERAKAFFRACGVEFRLPAS